LRRRLARSAAERSRNFLLSYWDPTPLLENRGTEGTFSFLSANQGITGTGLGLWVSAEILNKHGAKIRVRSRRQQPGQGTLFSILFSSDDWFRQ
jgi:K+-sensing histidine kinase KdpD